jgi:hypothetical protein
MRRRSKAQPAGAARQIGQFRRTVETIPFYAWDFDWRRPVTIAPASCKLLPFSSEALLVRFEIRDALSDLPAASDSVRRCGAVSVVRRECFSQAPLLLGQAHQDQLSNRSF